MLGELILSVSDSSGECANASRQLEDSDDQNAVRAIADAFIKSLREFELKYTVLERRLTFSKQEMESLQRALAIVTAEASLDPVTGLATRRRFDAALDQAVARADDHGQPLSLLMIDVDHFKSFNDQFGHLMGDSVLSLIGAMLKQSIKGQDTAARYGGEEFAVILPNTKLSSATVLAEQIRKKIVGRELTIRSSRKRPWTITISIGISEFRKGERPRTFIERADWCLYEAKRAGRNCTRFEDSCAEMRGDAA
jgi:diguanylate cyclase